MSRNSKDRQKLKGRREAAREKHRRNRLTKLRSRAPWMSIVEKADNYRADGEIAAAEHLLKEYDDNHPPQRDVLHGLLEIYHQLKEYGPYSRACKRMATLEPDNPAVQMMLAAGYMQGGRLALALQTFQRYLKRWPDDPMAEGARETVAAVEPELKEAMKELPFQGPDWLDWAALHEESMLGLAVGDPAAAFACGERLLARFSDFIPAMNNLSLAMFALGRIDESLGYSRRVLELQPDNFHALGDLAKHLLLSGLIDEARAACDRLKSVESPRPDIWSKKAEAFSFFGDDDAVLAAFEGARKHDALDYPNTETALLYHLAGVAAARQGDDARAKGYWKKSLKIAPWLHAAEENLADAALPVGDRNGPWPYAFNYWAVGADFRRIREIYEGDADDSERNVKRLREFCATNPAFSRLIPLLLDRGDPIGREFALAFAKDCATPEMFAALHEFALSRRGTDALRMGAINYLAQKGFLTSDRERIWNQGKQVDVEPLGFEIVFEAMGAAHSQAVNRWAQEAIEAGHNGDGARAEALYKRCIAAEGEQPMFLNNLAAIYLMQGRTAECEALLQSIRERWPDYFFGLIAQANKASEAGDIRQADEILTKLRHRKRLHNTEFAALAVAYIQLSIVRGEAQAANSWLELWKSVEPDHPQIPILETQVRRAESGGSLWKRLLGSGK